MPTTGDDRSVWVGGSLKNAQIVTGDDNAITFVAAEIPSAGSGSARAGTPKESGQSPDLANQVTWRSANILFADVKGSSALSDAQKQTFLTVILPLIKARISGLALRDSNTWGDGIVLMSDRIAELCEGALHIRNVFIDTNWARHGLPKLSIRISLHHGEYFEFQNPITNRRDFGGRAIDEAARLEPVTPAGRIWMTEQAMAMLKSYMKSDVSDYFAFDDMGEVDLPKNQGRIRVAELRRGHEPPAARA